MAQMERIFEIKNTGTEALIISNAKGSCGCTAPSWPKEPIAPGATSQLKVKYDTKRPDNKRAIFSNVINEPTKVVRIKGSVLPNQQVAFLPITLVQLTINEAHNTYNLFNYFRFLFLTKRNFLKELLLSQNRGR